MNQLIPHEQELNSYKVVASNAAKTPYWTKLGGEAGILSIMLMARELGISPMNSISGMFNVIQGKVEISGKGMAYLIRKGGHRLKLKLLTKEKCTIEGTRKDTEESMEASYTIDEARAAGLIKPGGAWIKCPEDMLYWRAMSRLARRLYTDCIGGCYVEGEIQEMAEKKPMKEVEPANLDEIEIEDVNLDLPVDVKAEDLDRYITYLSEQYSKSPAEIKGSAKANPDNFWTTFHKWEEDQKVVIDPVITEEKKEDLPPLEEIPF
ncbi:MAG TPA: hypothetical protein ENH65_02835 [Candidatus Aminicenantes bacterium]|nr:hypothetical protein [Candidatus Aminicenantes bacterium]